MPEKFLLFNPKTFPIVALGLVVTRDWVLEHWKDIVKLSVLILGITWTVGQQIQKQVSKLEMISLQQDDIHLLINKYEDANLAAHNALMETIGIMLSDIVIIKHKQEDVEEKSKDAYNLIFEHTRGTSGRVNRLESLENQLEGIKEKLDNE